MIAWSSGAPGWKHALRKISKSATDVLKAREEVEVCADTAMWKPILNHLYDSIYFDEAEYVMKFHTELEAVVDDVATTTQRKMM